MKRGLSDKFMGDLQNGILKSLLSRVRKDTTLDLQIRANGINIYYRGGSLLRVDPFKKTQGAYGFFFNDDYGNRGKRGSKIKVTPNLPPSVVADKTDCEAWISVVPLLKDTMDLWFGENPKDERALQQLVVWENNDSPWAKGTDYFIVDVEYDSRKGSAGDGGRFDLVALRWESDSTARKLKGKKRPKLVVIEMKAGDGALKGTAGLQKHLKDFKKLAGPQRSAALRREMAILLAQKRELGLIKSLVRNKNLIGSEAIDPEIDFMFLLAGHDPASRKLKTELNALDSPDRVQLCIANLMGFGLYKEHVLSLTEFMKHHRI